MHIYGGEKIRIINNNEFEYNTFAKSFLDLNAGDLIDVYDSTYVIREVCFNQDEQVFVIEVDYVFADIRMDDVDSGVRSF